MNPPVNERLFSNSEKPRRRDIVSTRAMDLLNLRRLPSRVGLTDAAILLNVGEHDIPAIIASGLLKPLGHPVANATKYFCTAELLDCAADREWLSKMSDVIYEFWRKKNAER